MNEKDGKDIKDLKDCKNTQAGAGMACFFVLGVLAALGVLLFHNLRVVSGHVVE